MQRSRSGILAAASQCLALIRCSSDKKDERRLVDEQVFPMGTAKQNIQSRKY